MRLNLIDVGATGGLELPWRRKPGLIGTVLSFEPNEPPSVSPGRISHDTAVWNYDGEATFTIYGEGGTGSSLLPQNYDWVRDNFDRIRHLGDPQLADTWLQRSQPKGTFTCQVRKLDTVLADLGPDRPRFQFLKSDTQSGEWFVLDGARDYLANECLGLELECYRFPLYKGLKTEDEVSALLDDLGFERCGWTGYKASFASQADYLFLKRDPAPKDRPYVEAIRRLYGVSGRNSIIKRVTLLDRVAARLRIAA